MNTFTLKNDELTLTINQLGAELSSIKDNKTGQEYLWNADPTYWKRHSPILFPIVGSLKNQSYRYDDEVYSMSQHGFARDMEFTFFKLTKTEIWFQLEANEETLKMYPFEFTLEVGYQLIDRSITVMWKVVNTDSKKMYFSIGAHPAFLCPLNTNEKQSDYSIAFGTKKPIRYLTIDSNGLVIKKPETNQDTLPTNHGLLPIHPNLFDQDALIIENSGCHKVSLVTPDKKPYVTVSFDTPLFGLWSPAKINAPFVCIEPWYGRCDSNDFDGDLEDREWGNSLDIGKVFETSYTIDIL